MKLSSKYPYLKQNKFLLSALLFVMAGCSLEKQSGFNRSMQNLTAHYNILFNANEILRLKQQSYALSFIDNYNDILSVYPDTVPQSKTADKDLDAAAAKANTIINIKEQSHYLGDAYLVLGKTNYLGGNYFNAVEYFSYVIRSFPQQPGLVQEAEAWKARTLMYLGQLPQAKVVLDTALQNIDPKKRNPVDIYGARLQYDINVQDYAEGEAMAILAIQYNHSSTQRLRWTFILAQLQELNKKPAEAFSNYSKIAKSNAVFEMAFNASLNRIRIEESQNGVSISRIDRLMSLLKDPNNKEFKDQIYFQIAELLMAGKDVDQAIKYYKQSVRYSLRNQSQKGLSYLRLAEIYFNKKADYLTSKKYYDSTLTSLPVNYPGYLAIQKKGTNLQLLADRLQIITREDTLQALARMDEKTRTALIDKMVGDRVLQQQAAATAAANASNALNNSGPSQIGGAVTGGSSFYFYNANAISQGYTDFKQKWGNRKLEDNWRRSNRSGSDITNNTSNSIQGNDPDAPVGQIPNGKGTFTAASYRQELTRGLPLTPALLSQSNLRIYNAYIDIGNFYRDVLDDKKEAIATFELILRRFPNDPNKPAIYYNLYRLYSDVDASKSDLYKNKLLKDYPETPFAKVISDPDFARKLDDRDVAFTRAYNKIFDLYTHKKYTAVIDSVPLMLKQYPGNKYSAQLAYLQTIAAGHGEKVGPFQDSLTQIVKMYPNDRLITPLVKQHLAYISANQPELLARNVVLADDDPRDIPFTLTQEYKEQTEYRKTPRQGGPEPLPIASAPEQKPAVPEQTAVTPPAAAPPAASQPAVTPPAQTALAVNQPAATAQPVSETPPVAQAEKKGDSLVIKTNPVLRKPDSVATAKVVQPETLSIFTMNDSTNYYFVVNVTSGTTNLASSRFGIGQFNRANYAGKGIRHQITDAGPDDQMIYVGLFLSLDGVKKYARAIIPLLPDIMKVPKEKYSFFIITKENLNKLADKKTLDSYVDYYQKNY